MAIEESHELAELKRHLEEAEAAAEAAAQKAAKAEKALKAEKSAHQLLSFEAHVGEAHVHRLKRDKAASQMRALFSAGIAAAARTLVSPPALD